MNVGFDATNILGHGGIKTYARELIKGLALEYPSDNFNLLTTFSSSKKKKLMELFSDYPNVNVLRALPHRNMLGDRLSCITEFLSTVMWSLSGRNLDMIHLTDAFGILSLPSIFVATVHDVFPLTRDEYSNSDLRSYYLRRTPETLRQALAVITPSTHVMESLNECYPGHNCPVIPIPEAASDDFRPRNPNLDMLKRLKLADTSYFLFVGRIDTRKNISGLIEAFLELPHEVRSKTSLALVLSGYPDDIRNFRSEYKNVLEGKGIVFLRDVPSEDLYSLYSSALAFVFPTFDEGFGLPVIEAMRSGCPVIASNISCIPEIAGDSAVLVDPRNSQELSSAMKTMAESPDMRERFRKLGLDRAELYSWRRTARETMKVYRSVLT